MKKILIFTITVILASILSFLPHDANALNPTDVTVSSDVTQTFNDMNVGFHVQVVDVNSGTKTLPSGSVMWNDGGAGGHFSNQSCTLIPRITISECSITYRSPPTAGPVTITANYSGDGTHAPNSGTLTLKVILFIITLKDEASCKSSLKGTWIVTNATCHIDGASLPIGTLNIDNTIFPNITLTNTGTINTNSNINNNGTIINSGYFVNYVTINNRGIITNTNSGLFNNAYQHPTINNFGTFNNKGTIINNSADGLIGTINNNGTINNSGIIHNYINGAINNKGTINNDGSMTNGGSVTNSGIITINNGGTMINSNKMVNNKSGTINNYGILNNNSHGIVTNNGLIIIFNPNGIAGILNNFGAIDNLGNIRSNDGTINNYATMRNEKSGIISNTSSTGIIYNGYLGSIENSGIINNKGKIENYHTISNKSIINNYKLINNHCGAIITGNQVNNISGGTVNNPCP